jgi:putative hemolysin
MSIGPALVVCLAIVAWLTAAATAVRSVSRIWLRHWAEQSLRGATTAELYLERPQRLLLAAATAVAATVFIAGTLIGAGTSPSVLRTVGWVLGMALALLVFGQLIPRAVARRWPTALVPVLLPILRLVDLALTPFMAIARRVTRALEPAPTPAAATTEQDNLEDLLREGALEGVGEATEIAIISGVVQFGQKTLGEVMTPRPDVFAIEEDVRGQTLALRIAQAGYSRVPIYRGSLDTITGMIHAFDVLREPESPPLRPVADAPASAKCNEFLFRMLRERRHLAVVRDAEGHTAGIVTLEDLLEELVGDIRDEHDEPIAPLPSTS